MRPHYESRRDESIRRWYRRFVGTDCPPTFSSARIVARERRFHRRRCPTRNAHRRGCEPRRWAHRGGTPRARSVQTRFIFSPEHQQPRLGLSHPCLPLRIGLHVGTVVVEEIALDVGLAGLVENAYSSVQRSGIILSGFGIAADMPSSRRLERQQIGAQRGFVCDAVRPERAPRLPVAPRPSLCATAS